MNDPKTIFIDPHDLDMVAFNSNEQVRARNAIFAVDVAMRTNYDALRAQLILQLSPVIVVQNDFSGGTYTLINDGTQEIVQPVSPIFELVKSVSHTPLGIYVIIAPYLKQPNVTDWVAPLQQFRSTLEYALGHISLAGLPQMAVDSCKKVLIGGMEFIDVSIAEGGFSIKSYEEFTEAVGPDILINMHFAAKAQIEGVEALLTRWRKQLGPEKWKNLYAIVLAIWTTEVKNQNWLILKHMMDESRVDSHLITISTAEPVEDTVAVALDNLARIVQDNVAAAMVFPGNSKLADALKGPEDLLASAIEKMIGCPHGKK